MEYVQRRIKIPKDIYKNVEKEAKKQKKSKHDIIVKALNSHFNKTTNSTQKTK